MKRWIQFSGFCAVLVAGVFSFSEEVLAGAVLLKGSNHEDYRGTPRLEFPDSVAAKAKSADEYLRVNGAKFRIPADLSNMELVSVHQSLIGTHTRYRQVLNGLPVEAAEIVVSQRKTDGSIYQVYNNTYPVENPVPASKNTMGKDAALQKAWDHLRVHGRLRHKPKADLVYVPFKNGFRLVYKTLMGVDGPLGYWEHKVDAVSGEIISVRRHEINEKYRANEIPDFTAYKGPTRLLKDEIARIDLETQVATKGAGPVAKTTTNGTALVFDPDPLTATANEALADGSGTSLFVSAYVSRTLVDITLDSGVYRLQGPWVSITNIAAESPATAPSTTTNGNWTAKRGNNAFNDAMCYFHIDQNQRYIQSLGYTGATGIQELSFPIDSDGLGGDDNAWYVPDQNYIAFGHGGVDDDEDADVILHEYGHAITFSIVSSWGGGDTGAIGEGFGDYWGASYSWTCANGSTFHPEWAFSWDGHSVGAWGGRVMDMTNLTYDSGHTYVDHETINGIPNYSDQLWAAPIYMAFRDLIDLGRPREEMDAIIIESFFGVSSGVTMRDMANATVTAAMTLFPGGPHATVYFNRFRNQDILITPSLPTPTLLYPVGGETMRTGTAINVQWNRNGAPTNATAVVEYNTALDGLGTYFQDNVEGGVNGWLASKTGGSSWAITSSSSHTPARSWFAVDDATKCDQFLARSSIPVSNDYFLAFWHSYNLEGGYDGGVVELSTNGSTWIDIGTNATKNGYNSRISSVDGSLIAGRRAFSGSSGGFIETRIPLTNYVGKTVAIRFRESDDSSVVVTGWWIDDIRIYVESPWQQITVTAANATNHVWTPELGVGGTNCGVRVKLTTGDTNYVDSAWATSSSFAIISNRAPNNISLSISSLLENQVGATTVGVFIATDPDETNTFTYALASGAGDTDNGSFSIDDNSNLVAMAAFDCEAQGSLSIRVRVTDQDGAWYEKALVITVLNVNETPADINLSNSIIQENRPAGTTVGSFITTDPDAANTFVYSLISGSGDTDNGSFSISGSNLLTAAVFDYEAKTNYSIRVRSADQGGLWVEKEFAIAVSNVYDFYNLVVFSAYGTPEPAGTNLYHHGTAVSASVAGSPVQNGAMQYACIGWKGTGSVPSTGSATNTGSFNITNTSTLDWQWTTNFWLDMSVNGSGTVSVVDNWFSRTSVVQVVATAESQWRFVSWSGDLTGCTVSTNRVTAPMTQARAITANFEPSTGSDFTINSMNISPDQPWVGGVFTASVTVVNNGKGGNGGYLYLWTNRLAAATVGLSGNKLVSVGTLAYGQPKTFVFTNLPVAVAGAKTLRAFIDATGLNAETNENNNQSTLAYTVVNKPDLTVSSVTFDPVEPSTGAVFSAYVVTRNIGTAAASNFHVSVWTNMAGVPADSTGENGGADVAVLNAGQSVTNIITGLQGGNISTARTFRAFVDSTHAVTNEMSEANNQLIKAYTPKAHADFAVTGIELSPSDPLKGKTFTAYVTVTNLSGISGNAGYLYVYTNSASVVPAKTKGTKFIYVGILAARQGKRLTAASLLAGNDGAKTFRAYVDATALTIEVAETNNQATLAYNVITKPDVQVTLITLTPAVPSRGGEFDAKVTLKNIGSAPASNVYVSVWANRSAMATNGLNTNVDGSAPSSATVGTIATNASLVYTFTGLDAGTGKVARMCRVFADSDLSLAEILETNNQLAKAYTPASRADFVITDITLSTTNPPVSSNFAANVTVKNIGYISGSAGYLDVWANKATNVMAGSTLRGDKYVYVGTLNTNATKVLTFTGVSAGSVATQRVFRAIVDSRVSTFNEVVETNNQETVDYTVGP